MSATVSPIPFNTRRDSALLRWQRLSYALSMNATREAGLSPRLASALAHRLRQATPWWVRVGVTARKTRLPGSDVQFTSAPLPSRVEQRQ